MSKLANHDCALSVQGLAKTYENGLEAIRDLTFDIGAGEFVCIVGPSGAGKTTLLRCLAGLLEKSDGEVFVDAERVTGPPEGLAMVFQEYSRSLLPWLTIGENVELPLREKGLSKSVSRAKAEEALEAVDLKDVWSAYPWQLSGGMQQRVAIARAVAYEPKILIMDEPFAAVDAQTRADLEDLVRALWKRLGITFVFVTHDIEEAVYLGQRVIVLSARPTIVLEDVAIELPTERDQITTRSEPIFDERRRHIYRLIQKAKAGFRG